MRRLALSGASTTTRVAVVVLGLVLLLTIVGPWVSPTSPTALEGVPFSAPSAEHVLGTDVLGRDVLSRVLHGGQSLVLLAIAATTAAVVVGTAIGLIAGYSRTLIDPVLMRLMDVILGFPAIILLLLFATGLGPGSATILLGAFVVQVPSIARVVRTATLEVSVRAYVEAAVARGERMLAVLVREILPNILGPLAAIAGPALTISVLIIAALNYFGLGAQPPAADWGSMISENQDGLAIQPWAVVVAALLIALFTVSANLIGDSLVRRRQGAFRRRRAVAAKRS